jgi:hypothetical protein
MGVRFIMRLKKDGTPWNNWQVGMAIMQEKNRIDAANHCRRTDTDRYAYWLQKTREGLARRGIEWRRNVQNVCRETQKKWVSDPSHCAVCKGMHWYNNGEKEVKGFTRPEGFVHGRLPGQKRNRHSWRKQC